VYGVCLRNGRIRLRGGGDLQIKRIVSDARRIQIVNESVFMRYRDKPGPAIGVSPHMGNWPYGHSWRLARCLGRSIEAGTTHKSRGTLADKEAVFIPAACSAAAYERRGGRLVSPRLSPLRRAVLPYAPRRPAEPSTGRRAKRHVKLRRATSG
jgi:hypothetical protein